MYDERRNINFDTNYLSPLIKYFFAIFFIISSLFVDAQDIESRKYSNEFLAIGVGARALGMSNSIVADVSDVTSGYWNPAGLTSITNGYEVALMHSEYFAGIAKYDYGAFAMNIDSESSIGISLIRFGVDDIPNTTQLIDNQGNINYDRITSFSAADYAFLFSYARKAGKAGLSYGANVKVIHRIVGEFATAWGFGFDLGSQFQSNNIKIGAMLRDATSTFNAWNYTNSQEFIDVLEATNNEVPENAIELTLPKLLLGIGYNTTISNKFSLYTELNADISTDGRRNAPISTDPVSIDPHFGLELSYAKRAFLRGGIGNFQESEDINGNRNILYLPTFGVGVKIYGVTLDYAFTDIGDRSAAIFSNIFSLKLDIQKSSK